MKIKVDIDDRFREPEIHICCNRESPEVADLHSLLENLFLEKITVYKNLEAKSVTLHETVRIYSQNKKVYLCTAEDMYEIKGRLYVLENKLQSRGFIRISNTEIVNITQIEKLDMTYTGTIKMIMKNGDITFVSRRYVGRIREILKQGAII